jgi:hypothetical protein
MTASRLRRIVVAIACVGLLSGCGESGKLQAPPEPDLRGNWTLVLPAGYKYEARIEYMGRLRYRIAVEVNSGGVYEVAGDELRMLNPGNDGTRHYVWKIEDKDNLLLVEAPTVGAVGSDYRGAVLSR